MPSAVRLREDYSAETLQVTCVLWPQPEIDEPATKAPPRRAA
jgi:hypothetical protein